MVDPEEKKGAEDAGSETEPSILDDLAVRIGWREKNPGDDPDKPWLNKADYIAKEIEAGRKNYKTLKAMRKDVQALQQTVQELRRQLESGSSGKAALTIQQLEAQFDRAVEEGDTKQAKELRDLIVQSQLRETSSSKLAVTNQEREMLRNQRLLEDWKEENTWYDAEDDMSMYADRIFDRYRDAKGQLLEPLEDILEEIGEKVKRKFSDYFQPSPSKGKSRVADVAGNTTITPPPQKVTWSQLTPQQREICERSVRNREFATRQDWINARFDLKK